MDSSEDDIVYLPSSVLFEYADKVVGEMLATMNEQKLKGFVLARIESVYPGFSPQGSMGDLEQAAAKYGLYINYIPASRNDAPFMVLLSRKNEVTDDDVAEIIRDSPPTPPLFPQD